MDLGIKKQITMKPHFEPAQAGELVVTGKDKIDIRLRHHQPEEVFVVFKDDHHAVPCNPHHFDELEWELHYKEGHYVLLIKWHVFGVREIFWAVRY